MSKSTYIRAKREKTIVFLSIDPKKDSLNQVKEKLNRALDNEKTSEEVRILVDGVNKGEYTLLDNVKTLENNDIVYFVYFDREDGQWENVDITEPELLDDDDIEEEEVFTKKEKGKGRA